MKVAIYARVSTQDQNTIPMQIKKCREYAKSRNWQVIHVLKDIGSGAKKRPERENIINLCRKRAVDLVLVWKLDRWGRSVSDVVTTLEELRELGVKFVSITEALDFTTASGRAMSGLLSVFAEFERDMIRERVVAGLEHARSKGIILGRPKTIHSKEKEIRAMWPVHKNKSYISKKLGISRRSISRALSDINNRI